MEDKHRLQAALIEETYQRTLVASLSFLFLSTVLMTFDFDNARLHQPMVSIGIGVAILSLVRATLSLLGKSKRIRAIDYLPHLHFMTILNSTLWGLALTLEALLSDPNGIQKMIPFMLMLGLASAGPTSLITTPRIQIYFYFMILFSPAMAYLVKIYEGSFPLNVAIVPALLFVAFVYYIYTGRGVRSLFIQNLKNTFKLQVEKEKLRITTRSQLEQAEKLSTLGQMAGGIAHEINNPITVIQGYCSQLETTLKKYPPDSPRALELVGKIGKTVNRITKIVRGLKTMSRDASVDPFEVGNLNELLEDTLSFCTDRIQSQGITLTYEPLTIPLHYEGRATELSQVFLNILNNSVDAIEHLKEKWIKIVVTEQQNFIEIRFHDSGSGIPLATETKLFDPFFTTKANGKGTGLGLSISRTIISNHQGDLKIDHHFENTCFLIRLPIKSSKAALSAA